MPNFNFILKLAKTSATLSLLTLAIAFGSSLFIPKANAAHFPILHSGLSKTVQAVRTQNRHHFNRNKISAKRKIALAAMQYALKQVADGASYHWHHKKSQLKGRIKPTVTYLNNTGQLCRHIYISLTYITAHKNSQALACRNSQGQWRVKS